MPLKFLALTEYTLHLILATKGYTTSHTTEFKETTDHPQKKYVAFHPVIITTLSSCAVILLVYLSNI